MWSWKTQKPNITARPAQNSPVYHSGWAICEELCYRLILLNIKKKISRVTLVTFPPGELIWLKVDKCWALTVSAAPTEQHPAQISGFDMLKKVKVILNIQSDWTIWYFSHKLLSQVFGHLPVNNSKVLLNKKRGKHLFMYHMEIQITMIPEHDRNKFHDLQLSKHFNPTSTEQISLCMKAEARPHRETERWLWCGDYLPWD